MPYDSAVRAFSGEGVDKYAIATDTTIKITVVAMLCHKKSVCVSGISPLMLNSDAGIALFVAISIAAEDDSPIAHTPPSPRYAAAPAPPQSIPFTQFASSRTNSPLNIMLNPHELS